MGSIMPSTTLDRSEFDSIPDTIKAFRTYKITCPYEPPLHIKHCNTYLPYETQQQQC